MWRKNWSSFCIWRRSLLGCSILQTKNGVFLEGSMTSFPYSSGSGHCCRVHSSRPLASCRHLAAPEEPPSCRTREVGVHRTRSNQTRLARPLLRLVQCGLKLENSSRRRTERKRTVMEESLFALLYRPPPSFLFLRVAWWLGCPC